ncbi:MAG TPA: response regulator transcription factor [Gemmatimonadaceae bacterium]|jgi:DNA-binding NarL/FixJ family response regulator|nr:response regulator transcription factor [Gemmatimonadaceae bacterium]
MTKVLIADDHAVVRAGLRELLLQRGSFSVVGEASDGDQLLKIAGEVPADVLLLDVSMPGPPFLDVLQRVRTQYPQLRVLVLTMHPEDQFAVRALRAGASGYLTKDRTPAELVDAVTRIARGGRYISATLAERLSWALDGDFRAAPHDVLSDREMQVLLLLGAGHSVKEASETLRLSMKTVSTFRKRMMKKMSFATNADAVQYVVRQGLLRPDSA